ncbi:MAG TPA: ABC transporter permease [Fulvivirga sp.]|nr:ABC transporter permease [Fulvivirga sp.]
MLKNHIKIAFRNLMRFKVYAAINLIGLALGLTVGLLILIFVTDELSFDKFHVNGDRIYKVVTHNKKGGTSETNAWPVAYKLKHEFPEVDKMVYTRNASSLLVNYEGKEYEHNTYYAGPDFFNIFSFNMVEGDPQHALDDPFSLVITESIKKRYFGNDVVLGKTLTLLDTVDFKITGVIKEVPQQSSIQFEMLVSFATLEKLNGFSYSDGWGNFNVRNYILLKKGANIQSLASKAKDMYMDKANAGDRFRELGMDFDVQFIPLADIYLKSDVRNGFGPKSSIDKIYLVSGIAVFVLLLACINFINLTTARSVFRAKEVGLRKIVGSSRGALFVQFLGEAFMLTIMAMGLVALLIDFTLPFFNQLMDKQYAIGTLFTPTVLIGAIIITLLVSFFSGVYPALVLSGYKPVEVLKGRMHSSAKGVRLRRSLVVFQFLISGALVLATLIVLKQLDFMRNQDLGFAKDQILVLDATRVKRSTNQEPFINAIKGLSFVKDASFTNALPGRPGWLGQWAYPEVMSEATQVDTEYMAIDENYLNTLDLKLLAGKNFDLNNPAELDEGVIINETTVKAMGWQTPENAIGKKIVSPSERPQGTVIGVVSDFHGQGLQYKIWPMVMDYRSYEYGRYYAIRFTTGATSQLIDDVKQQWNTYLGDNTFDYFFLDQDFDRQYKSEERLMTFYVVFAILTVVIAVIGLLGLVSFMVVSRTKEIGIRKVLGAGVFTIAGILTKEFVALVLIANLIAIPLVWYFGKLWLADFAYHMTIDPTIFIYALLASITLAVVTISFQTIKAALLNPVDTLRSE